MNRWIRRGLYAVAGVAVIAAAAVAAGEMLAERKQNRRIDVKVAAVAIPTDAAALARGDYLYRSRGCADCHGADGAGRVFVDDGKGLRLAGPNITAGAGGVVASYTAADWGRTVRHGVKPDGRPARVMPSEDYNRLTDADLGALVAHVKSLPPKAGSGAQIALPLPVRLLYAAGAISDAAEKIDHARPPARPVAEAVNAEHGAYVAAMCTGCHGARFSGGKIPGGPPDWPAASNLTPGAGSVLPRYPDAESFVAMLRTGKRPDGSAVRVMPFEALGALNDTDARAIHAFLKTLPPVAEGNR